MKKFIEKMRKDWRENRLEVVHRTLAVVMTLVMVVSVMPEMIGEATRNSRMHFYAYNSSSSTVASASGKAKDLIPPYVFAQAPTETGQIGWVSICSWSGGSRREYQNGNTLASYWSWEADRKYNVPSSVAVNIKSYPVVARNISGKIQVRDNATGNIERTITPISWSGAPDSGVQSGGYSHYLYTLVFNSNDFKRQGYKIWKTNIGVGTNNSFGLAYNTGAVHSSCSVTGCGRQDMAELSWQARNKSIAPNTDVNAPLLNNPTVTMTSRSYIDLNKKHIENKATGHAQGNLSASNTFYPVWEMQWVVADPVYIKYYPNYSGGNGSLTDGPFPGDSATPVTLRNATAFSRTHYTIASWNTNADGTGTTYSPGQNITVSNTGLTLYAQWKQSEFQVKYNANGATQGTAPVNNNWYATGTNAPVAGSNGLKKNHMVFDCWNTKADGTGTNYAAGSTVPIGNGDVTLYAKWKNAPTWTLTYVKGDPTATGSMAQETYYNDGITDASGNLINAKVTVKSNGFAKPNSTFKNWEREDGTLWNPSQIFYMNNHHTLTARWGGGLIYDKDGATVGVAPTDDTVYDIGDNAIAKDRFPGGGSGVTPNPNRLRRDGFVFTGWDNVSGQDNGNPPDYAVGDPIPMTQNRTVYAHWAPATEYQVEYDLNPPGGLSPSDMVGTLPTDSTSYYKDELNETISVKLNTMALPKYYFSKWRDKDTGNLYSPGQTFNLDPAHSSMPNKIHLEAVWNPATPYNVTYDENLPAGASLDAGSPGAPVDTHSPYYNDGINHMVTVLGDNGMTMNGYEFAGWNTRSDGTGADYDPGDTFNIGSAYGTNVTLYAKWKKGLTITGVNDTDKVYDGTPDWTGTVTFTGQSPADDVDIHYASAAYEHVNPLLADKDAETGKKLVLNDLTLTGSDANKYYIKDASVGTYVAATATTPSRYETTGDITPRAITIAPALTTAAVDIWEGDNVPGFTCNLTSGTMAPGELVSPDLGTPTYTCEKVNADGTIDTLTPGSPASVIGGYTLKVSGLSNQNYTITYQDTAITVHPAGSNLARVRYYAGNNGQGTPPTDAAVYYTFPANPSANSHVTVLPKGSLYNPGCTFLGWNTNPNGTDTMTKADGTTTNLFVPGDTFIIQGDTDLYAIWQGATPLTLTGITPLTRPYDGTDHWSGTITANVPAGEDVTVTYTTGAYDNKNAGTGKTITLTGIALTGADAYKYHLANGGMYNSATNEITVHSGEITPLPITIRADMSPNVLNENDPVPTLSISDVSISPSSPNGLVGGDSLATDFGTPTFTISNAAGNVLIPGSPATPAGIYNVAVGGLSNSNYVITVENTQVSVSSATLGTPIQVTYHANHSHATGLVPADSNIYYNTAPHDVVPVLSHDGGLAGGAGGVAPVPGTVDGSLSVPGCTFTGWNTKADGTGITVKTDGLSTNRLQAGDAFSIAGMVGITNVELYAQWTPDYPLTIQSLSDTSKVYDNSDTWGGSFTLSGIQAGDDVQLTWTDGKFDSKDVGNRIITAENLQLTGADAYKYYLTPDTNGWYDATTNKVTYPNAQITKRPITIKAQVTSDNPVKAGSTPPTYSYQHVAGTFAPGESIADLDDSGVTYTLVDLSGNPVNFASITSAGSYRVKVSGLVNPNYDITYVDEILLVSDDDQTPAHVIYSAPSATSGSVPVDNNVYMVHTNPAIPNPQATILGEGDLERSGYAFAGWKNTHTGAIVQPGDTISISGMVYLEAVWTGDTPLTIIDLSDKEKTYDGNTNWTGQPVTQGIIAGDDVTVEYDNGRYAAKDVGQRVIRLENVRLTGADAGKYVLVGSAIYDADEKKAEADGQIDPLEIEVLPVVQGFAPDAAVIPQGDSIPPYELYLPATSHIIAPDELSDFGTPVYSCKNYLGEELSSNGTPGYYRLSVSGLSHSNYDLTTDSTLVALWAPGMQPAKVTYNANGGNGVPPVDNNLYATFDDPALNNIVTVLGNTLTRSGYQFVGWNTQANGHGITYQPGETFRIMGDTILYAKWEKIVEPDDPTPDDPTPDNPTPDDPDPDNPTPDNPTPDDPKPHKPQPKNPVKPGGSVKPAAISSNPAEKKEKKEGEYFFEPERSYALNKDSLVFDSENEIPKGSEPYKGIYAGSGGKGFSSAFANIWSCIIHWIILLGILLTILYDTLRRLFIKRKDEYSEPSTFFDGLLPMLPLPLVFIFFFLRQCFLDFWMLMLWILVAELGKYFLQRAYRQKEPASRQSDREAR